MIRAALIAAVIIVAVVATPSMLRPGLNSADLIVMLSPLVILWIGSHRPRPKRPVSPYYDREVDQ